jgi:diguanylate cyclase (GGDEF)-like protein/PAS domain S-box-containing protein
MCDTRIEAGRPPPCGSAVGLGYGRRHLGRPCGESPLRCCRAKRAISNTYQSHREWMRASCCGLFAFLFLLVGGSAYALNPELQVSQYVLDTWQTADGLPENSATAIARTPDGYLWVATAEGLARFDGVRFTVFDHSNEPAIPSKSIYALHVDRGGRLLIGTGDGMAVLENGRFKQYGMAAGLNHLVIITFLEDKSGRIWVGTRNGLFEFDGTHSRVFGTSDGLGDSRIRALVEDRNGTVWVATATAGLYRFDGKAFESVQLGPGATDNSVSAMYADIDGALWFGTRSGGLYRRMGDRNELVAPPGRLGSRVNALTRDRDGNLWIANIGGGLVRLRDGVFSTLGISAFPSGDLRTLYEDNEGSLWVGSSGGGVSRLRDGKFAPLGVPEGLQGNVAWTIVPRADGGIWVGTDAGLSSYIGTTFSHIAEPKGFENARVRALLEDRKGALWVGTGGAGVYRRDGDRVTVFNRHNGLSGDSVGAIAEDRQGRIWIGTDVGLDLIDKDTVASMQSLLHASSTVQIAVIHEDRAGKLWVATWGDGVFVIDGQTTRHLGLADGLPSHAVTAIYEDERGVIWLGTMEGLAVWRDGRLTSLASFAAPLRQTITQVLEDDQHRIWLTSNKGLTSIARASLDALAAGGSIALDIHSYDTADGLRTAEFDGGNTSAGCRTADGRLWFPSILGIVSVDPLHIRSNTLAPPVQIEEVIADGVSLPPTQGLEVSPGRRQWEFHYTALSLLVPKRSLFRYRLEGFDQAWVDAGTRRTAYYNRVPPGTYTFRVIASNDDGVWNDVGASFRFTLKPLFYQTLWFALLCSAGMLALIVAWHYWRLARLRRLAAALTEQVAQRTAELNESNAQLGTELVERKAAETALREHDALLKVVTKSAEELLGTHHDDAISLVLELIGQTVAVSRVQLNAIQTDTQGHLRSTVRYEWCAPEVTGVIDNPLFQELDLTQNFAKAVAPALSGDATSFFVDDISGQYRALFVAAKMRSFLQIPVQVEEKLWGSLNFIDSSDRKRDWSWAETDTLKTLAGLIGVSITRARYVKELADANMIVQNSPTILYRLRGEPSFPLIYVSHNITKFGHDAKKLMASNDWATTLIDARDLSKVSAAMASMLEKDTQGAAVEFRLRTGGDSYRWVENRYTPVRDSQGRLIEVEGIIVDITERKAAEEKISLLARTDGLTGLANRATFIERLRHAFAAAQRGAGAFAILYIDLDHFKPVNDTLGHPVGDQLLREVSERLKSLVRETDVVARLGGDEFAVLQLEMGEPANAGTLAGKIQQSIAQPFTLSGNTVSISASIGVCPYQGSSTGPDALLAQADLALYRSKDEGRNRYRFHSDDLDHLVLERVTLTEDLRKAIDKGELELHFQPQVELVSGRIVGMEALVRWNHPTRGLLMPDVFVPVAEKTGTMVALGHWVLDHACQQMKRWRDQGVAPPLMAINLAFAQLKTKRELVRDVADTAAKWGIAPSDLEFDVTEATLAQATLAQNDVLTQLRDIGAKVAIDDFGTEYSSFDYLREYGVSHIKIAQAYLNTSTESDPNRAATLRAILTIARDLNIGVIAEGVETQEQRELLVTAGGTTHAQGYYFSKAVDVAQAEELLRQGSAKPMTEQGESILVSALLAGKAR